MQNLTQMLMQQWGRIAVRQATNRHALLLTTSAMMAMLLVGCESVRNALVASPSSSPYVQDFTSLSMENSEGSPNYFTITAKNPSGLTGRDYVVVFTGVDAGNLDLTGGDIALLVEYDMPVQSGFGSYAQAFAFLVNDVNTITPGSYDIVFTYNVIDKATGEKNSGNTYSIELTIPEPSDPADMILENIVKEDGEAVLTFSLISDEMAEKLVQSNVLLLTGLEKAGDPVYDEENNTLSYTVGINEVEALLRLADGHHKFTMTLGEDSYTTGDIFIDVTSDPPAAEFLLYGDGVGEGSAFIFSVVDTLFYIYLPNDEYERFSILQSDMPILESGEELVVISDQNKEYTLTLLNTAEHNYVLTDNNLDDGNQSYSEEGSVYFVKATNDSLASPYYISLYDVFFDYTADGVDGMDYASSAIMTELESESSVSFTDETYTLTKDDEEWIISLVDEMS